MRRELMLEVLDSVKHSLHPKADTLVNSCFCFDGWAVHAYDQTTATLIDFVSDFQGGVNGKLLLDFLRGCSADEVEIGVDPDDSDKARIKCGRPVVRLPYFKPEDFAFEPPPDMKALRHHFELQDDFIPKLSKAATHMATTPHGPWNDGVAYEARTDKTFIYAANNRTAIRVVCEERGFDEPWCMVIPPVAVWNILALGRKHKPAKMSIGRNCFGIAFDGTAGPAFISKIQRVRKVPQYHDIFDPKESRIEKLVPIPPKLKDSLERCRLAASGDSLTPTKVTADGEKIRLYAKGPSIGVSDYVSSKHPAKDCVVFAASVLAGLDGADKIGFFKDVVMTTGPDFLFMATTLRA
jgi:hypothetical protein